MRDEMNNFLAQAFDWGRFPKLAAIFEHRPRGNVYWQELAEFVDAAVERRLGERGRQRKRKERDR